MRSDFSLKIPRATSLHFESGAVIHVDSPNNCRKLRKLCVFPCQFVICLIVNDMVI